MPGITKPDDRRALILGIAGSSHWVTIRAQSEKCGFDNHAVGSIPDGIQCLLDARGALYFDKVCVAVLGEKLFDRSESNRQILNFYKAIYSVLNHLEQSDDKKFIMLYSKLSNVTLSVGMQNFTAFDFLSIPLRVRMDALYFKCIEIENEKHRDASPPIKKTNNF